MLFRLQCINGYLVWWLTMVHFVAGITLTVSPSNVIEVNEVATLQCELDTNPLPPIIARFADSQRNTLCVLEPKNGSCKNTTDPCLTQYKAFCPSETVFTIQVNVSMTWNGGSIYCDSIYSRSNTVNFTVIVPVTSVTITPTLITVIAGQQMNLTCTTSYCNPPANITWYMSSTDITSQSTNTTDVSNNLVKTTSQLLSQVVKTDNGKQVYCTASNILGRSVQSMMHTVIVWYKPEVTTSITNPYRIIEGKTATLECRVTAANPNSSITWRWYKTDNPSDVLHNGPYLSISNIQRNRSGSYSCIASNIVGKSFAASIYLDVQYKPEIIDKPSTLVNESEKVILTRTIVSNPLVDVQWYKGFKLLCSQLSVKNATYILEKASCTDTTNFTLVASNEVERNVTALVELLVNCKPRADTTNITLWVTGITELNFSIKVIAYPEPKYKLDYGNGTRNNPMMDTITRNAVNNFTIIFHQKTVKEHDYGTYHLKIWNLFGITTIIVNVFKQRKPEYPRNIGVTCEGTCATVQWISSFNGGDHQTFIVFALNGQQNGNQSIRIQDMGENKIHRVNVQNLQPSMTYVFYVSAQNNHGFSISDIISCITSKETSHSQTGAIAGGVAGTLVLIMIVVVTVFLVHKRYTCSITFKKRKSSTTDNFNDFSEEVTKANKDKSLYTTFTEQQQENVETNMYDELTGNESARNYEAILMKETRGNNEKLYEELQSQPDGYDGERNSNEPRKPL